MTTVVKSLTTWQRHEKRWRGCRLCPLWKKRKSVVLARGDVPASVLFVGEAPGKSEDALGLPFVGAAGKLLDAIIDRALAGRKLRLAWSNLICCLPLNSDGDKTSEPPPESVEACEPRLVEFIQLCKPKLLVCVGREAANYLISGARTGADGLCSLPARHAGKLVVRCAEITHPANILRDDTPRKSLTFQRCVVTLANAAKEVFG